MFTVVDKSSSQLCSSMACRWQRKKWKYLLRKSLEHIRLSQIATRCWIRIKEKLVQLIRRHGWGFAVAYYCVPIYQEYSLKDQKCWIFCDMQLYLTAFKGFGYILINVGLMVFPPPNQNADSLRSPLAFRLCKDIFVTVTVWNTCFGNKLLAHTFSVIQEVAQLPKTLEHERKTLCCLFIGKFTNSA